MGQIKHNIKLVDTDFSNPYNYYLNFEDYVKFVENNYIYIKKGALFYILPKKIYSRYNFNDSLSENGMLHVVNIEYCFGLLSIGVQNVHAVEEIIDEIINNKNICKLDEDELFLKNTFFNPIYGLKVNWLSGMAQGMFASLCIRMYIITGKEKYKILNDSAIKVMLKPISKGGCALYKGSDIWFEEYVDQRRSSYVLNGNIFSIFSLIDSFYFDREKYCEILDKSIETLRLKIPKYLSDEFSYYDSLGHIADHSYNDLHIKQLKIVNRYLHERNNSPIENKFEVLKYEKIRKSFYMKSKWLMNKLVTLRRIVFYGFYLYK